MNNLKDILCAIRDFEAELEHYYLYDQKDTEAIARLEQKIELEHIKYDELLPEGIDLQVGIHSRDEPFDSKMELYDEIGVPSSGTFNEYPIVTKMCEDLLKQAKESND